MYTEIVGDLEILGNTKGQSNGNNLGFGLNVETFGDGEVDTHEEDNDYYDLQNSDFECDEISDEGDMINDTDSLAQKMNLDYPMTASHFKKNFKDSSLSSNLTSTVSPVLTMNYNFNHIDGKFNFTGINQVSSHAKDSLDFVSNDILGVNDKQQELIRDPLISSVAGSISSSSFSLDLSNDQLSPSSILSSIDLKPFNQSQSDLDKEITTDHDHRPTLQSTASSSSFLMINIPPSIISKHKNEIPSAAGSSSANYVKQPRQGRYSTARKNALSQTGKIATARKVGNSPDHVPNDDLSVYSQSTKETSIMTDINILDSAGPSINDHNKKVSDSRLSAQGLAQVLNLDSPVEALKRERYILDIFENDLHYPLGYKTWVRDTTKEYRTKLIDQLYDRVKEKYPEYDRHVLETIIRRATYYMMQSRLRRERRAKAKGIKVARSTSSASSLT